MSTAPSSRPILVGLLLPLPALAQLGIDRPGDERLELPPFEPPEKKRGTILPPLLLPTERDTRGLSGGVTVVLREILIRGNTVLPQDELSAIAEPYVGREVSFADLEALRDQLTLAYIERGYVTSGAVIPAQSLEDGRRFSRDSGGILQKSRGIAARGGVGGGHDPRRLPKRCFALRRLRAVGAGFRR